MVRESLLITLAVCSSVSRAEAEQHRILSLIQDDFGKVDNSFYFEAIAASSCIKLLKRYCEEIENRNLLGVLPQKAQRHQGT